MITKQEQALDTILDLVQYRETDFELALAATTTIYRLMENGHGDLALKVLETYGPEREEN